MLYCPYAKPNGSHHHHRFCIFLSNRMAKRIPKNVGRTYFSYFRMDGRLFLLSRKPQNSRGPYRRHFLPALLKFLISTLLKSIIHPPKDDEENETPQELGRLAGGFLNTFWSGSIFVLTIVSVTMIPFSLPYLQEIRDDIMKSHTYKLAEPYLPKELPKNGADIQKAMAALKDPAQAQTLQKSDEYKNLYNDPKIKNLLADKDLSKMIENKNFIQLLSNPKIQEIFQDKKLIHKILQFNQKLIQSSQNPPSGKE